jgi:ATP-dependent Clp protease ATP-binding subunit ClpA
VKILGGLRGDYESFHGVRYGPSALEAAVDLSVRYLTDRKLPDKAIDLIDEAGAARRLVGGRQVGVQHIQRIVSSAARVPAETVDRNDRESLKALEQELSKRVFGQQEAIKKISRAVKMARAGLRPVEKPIGSFLFAGPTGVGKTELAKQLADILGVGFIRFDMSEYMERHTVSRLIGAPPGYVGFDQGGLLTDAVTKNPHAVLLLDEIEKAHPDVFNILLQVMDHGSLTDNNGRKADLRHVVLIMTSNVGASDLSKRKLGFGEADLYGDNEAAYKRLFAPEFRNRLDAKIDFNALSREVVVRIVQRLISELEGRLLNRKVRIDISDEATAHLANKGYDPVFGARPLARLIQTEISEPLSEEILYGALEHGGTLEIRLSDEGEKLSFHYQAAPRKPVKKKTTRKEAVKTD